MPPLVQRANQRDMGALAPTLRDVWTYFNLVSNIVLLPMLVATFLFSKRARRHPTLVNVCMTWILSGIFSLLLFFGGQASGPEPSKALCIAQTSLLYGITPMWSVAVLVLLYHIIVVTKTPHAADKGRAKLLLMLAAPYIAQCAFSIATLATSLAHPEKVTRHRRYFYCALQNSPLSNAMALFTGAVGIMISGLMVYLAVLLWRNWHGMRHAGMPSGLNLQLLLRVFIFGVYIVFGFAVNIISMVAPHNLAPDMYGATSMSLLYSLCSPRLTHHPSRYGRVPGVWYPDRRANDVVPLVEARAAGRDGLFAARGELAAYARSDEVRRAAARGE
ncbi:hypothetical protein C8J57DRAFT_1279773 [Mycena rebaudengoi]|nr:hypothetical protein C8J57DRAFT_1279773 [Mycena rebaudengoi]